LNGEKAINFTPGHSNQLRLNRVIRYLLQKYPYEENKWRIIVPISLFIAFFMVIFQPFGLSDFNFNFKYLFLAGYGLVTLVVLIGVNVGLPSLFPATFNEEKWTVGREILFFLLILFSIGLANLIYSTFFLEFRLTISSILIFQAFTLAVGIIPLAMLTLIKQSYLSRKNRETAERINVGLHPFTVSPNPGKSVLLASDSGKEELSLSSGDLLFIKSDGNYITAGFLKNGRFQSALYRNTMKYAEEQLADFPEFFRSHRSWIVNTSRISRVSGNSQGLRLSLEGYPEEIPVARNLTAGFRKKISKD
jgi:hypothetical protein